MFAQLEIVTFVRCKGGRRIGLDSCKVIKSRCAVAIEAFTTKSLVDQGVHVLSL
jgi:hypothetical protein